MSNNTPHNKLNVLVISNLRPRFNGDFRNIFVHDYISSIIPYCNVKVLSISLLGESGVFSDKLPNGVPYTHFAVGNQPMIKILKPMYYIYWFFKSISLGKKMNKIDVIHCHNSILQGSVAYVLSKKMKAKLVLTEHTGPFSNISKHRFKKAIAKFIMEKADIVLTVSNHLKQEILDAGILPQRIKTTYNPVDTELFKPNFVVNKKILFAGRLDNFKGALRVLNAFEMIKNKLPDWSLTIIGEGQDLHPIKQKIAGSKDLSNNVLVKGTLTKKVIAKEMQNSSLFVFPSAHESFGLVIAEAMSCGIPVLVGNRSAPQEYVSEKCGKLVDPNNIEQIANGILELINRKESFVQQEIRKNIVDSFSFAVFGKKLNQIYSQL